MSSQLQAQVPPGEYQWTYDQEEIVIPLQMERGERLVIVADSSVQLYRIRESDLYFSRRPDSDQLGWAGVLVPDTSGLTIHYTEVIFDSELLAQDTDWEEPVERFAERSLGWAQANRSKVVVDTIAGIPVLTWAGHEEAIEMCRASLRRNAVTGAPETLERQSCEMVLLPTALDSLHILPLRGIVPCTMAEGRFLPTWPEYERGHATFLEPAKEIPLCDQPEAVESYRFTWLRSFHEPIIVRIEKQRDRYILTATVLSGMGGYQPGEVVISYMREVNEDAWSAVVGLIEELPFWSDDIPDKRYILMTDGATWRIEGFRDSMFRTLIRQSPRSGPLRELGLLLLELGDMMPDDPVTIY